MFVALSLQFYINYIVLSIFTLLFFTYLITIFTQLYYSAVICFVAVLFQDVGASGEELPGPLGLRGPVKRGHCLTIESRKLL